MNSANSWKLATQASSWLQQSIKASEPRGPKSDLRYLMKWSELALVQINYTNSSPSMRLMNLELFWSSHVFVHYWVNKQIIYIQILTCKIKFRISLRMELFCNPSLTSLKVKYIKIQINIKNITLISLFFF